MEDTASRVTSSFSEHKEALLAAVVEEGDLFLLLWVTTSPLRWSRYSPPQAFQATGTAYVRAAWEYPTHYRVMFGKGLENCNHDPSLVRVSQATFEIRVSIIQAGQASSVRKAGQA